MRAVEALADLVSPNRVIGVMSSGLGSIARKEGGGREFIDEQGRACHDDALVCSARSRWFRRHRPRIVRTNMIGRHAQLGVEDCISGAFVWSPL